MIIAALKEAAEKATPGEWELWGTKHGHTVISPDHGWSVMSLPEGDPQNEANARYITAANPSTILSVIARMEALEEAAQGVLASWDARRAGDREKLKTYEGRQYWSPTASMVDSRAIATLRAALAISETQVEK